MYVPEHKLLFVHIPKTGGQTVTRYIYSCLGIEEHFKDMKSRKRHKTIESLLSSDVPDDKYIFTKNSSRLLPGPRVLTHMKLTEYFDHGYVDTSLFENITKFAVVRNPYDRVISACNFNKVSKSLRSIKSQAQNSNKKLDKPRHFMKQIDYVTKDGQVMVDHILKTETLSEDLPIFLKKHFNLESDNFKSVNVKQSDSYNIRKNLKKDIIKWINDYYHDDFVNFNYEKVSYD